MELAAQRMLIMSQGGLHAAAPELLYECYNRLNRRVTAELLAVDVADFVGEVAEPTDQDIAALYEKGKDGFHFRCRPNLDSNGGSRSRSAISRACSTNSCSAKWTRFGRRSRTSRLRSTTRTTRPPNSRCRNCRPRNPRRRHGPTAAGQPSAEAARRLRRAAADRSSGQQPDPGAPGDLPTRRRASQRTAPDHRRRARRRRPNRHHRRPRTAPPAEPGTPDRIHPLPPAKRRIQQPDASDGWRDRCASPADEIRLVSYQSDDPPQQPAEHCRPGTGRRPIRRPRPTPRHPPAEPTAGPATGDAPDRARSGAPEAATGDGDRSRRDAGEGELQPTPRRRQPARHRAPKPRHDERRGEARREPSEDTSRWTTHCAKKSAHTWPVARPASRRRRNSKRRSTKCAVLVERYAQQLSRSKLLSNGQAPAPLEFEAIAKENNLSTRRRRCWTCWTSPKSSRPIRPTATRPITNSRGPPRRCSASRRAWSAGRWPMSALARDLALFVPRRLVDGDRAAGRVPDPAGEAVCLLARGSGAGRGAAAGRYSRRSGESLEDAAGPAAGPRQGRTTGQTGGRSRQAAGRGVCRQRRQSHQVESVQLDDARRNARQHAASADVESRDGHGRRPASHDLRVPGRTSCRRCSIWTWARSVWRSTSRRSSCTSCGWTARNRTDEQRREAFFAAGVTPRSELPGPDGTGGHRPRLVHAAWKRSSRSTGNASAERRNWRFE